MYLQDVPRVDIRVERLFIVEQMPHVHDVLHAPRSKIGPYWASEPGWPSTATLDRGSSPFLCSFFLFWGETHENFLFWPSPVSWFDVQDNGQSSNKKPPFFDRESPHPMITNLPSLHCGTSRRISQSASISACTLKAHALRNTESCFSFSCLR